MGSGVDHLSRNPSQRASFALAATGIARADFERVAANPPGADLSLPGTAFKPLDGRVKAGVFRPVQFDANASN